VDQTHSDIYERVTNQVLRAMEAGTKEFRMPWHVATPDALSPVNASSKQNYRGVNVLSLWSSAQLEGYPSGLWATYKQWKELGAQVRTGEKGTPVVFWKFPETREAGTVPSVEEEVRKRPIARGYVVFNVAQVDGYKPPERCGPSESERVKAAENFFFSLGADIRHGNCGAGYDREKDRIEMPALSNFHTVAGYYAVLAHEITHWSGAENRLARDLSGRFGSKAYAAEELVAELGAAFQMARLGLSAEPRSEHAAYLENWCSLLRDDKRAIFTAAGKAQEAVTWLEREHEAALAKKPETGGSMQERNYENLMRLLGGEDSRRIEAKGYMPLVVEKIEGSSLISLCHYGEQNGDLMRDPEVVFRVEEGAGAKPVYFRNDYASVEHATTPGLFGDVPVQPSLQKSLDSFVADWWRNIEEQGFFDKAKTNQEEKGLAAGGAEETTAAEKVTTRFVRAFEHAASAYGDQDPRVTLMDFLADARHWCDAKGVDFEACLERSGEIYRQEVRRAEEHGDGHSR
jgi:antirestriction protein ArdC